MTEKAITTREKHPGRVAQGHRLATLMKKRTVYRTVYITVYRKVYSAAYSTVK